MSGALAIRLAESGRVPDSLVRAGIRLGCAHRLRTVRAAFESDPAGELERFLTALDQAPIAEATDEANTQHYELPPAFFELVLGPRRKYSGCDWGPGDDLARAEERALDLVCTRADLANGQRILELGCGWGSLTLFMAERFPGASIVAVSNSKPQREQILAEAAIRGLSNVNVVTADINTFAPEGVFDRIVTIEMLEHVRNYRALFERFAQWLKPDGALFVHVFRHRLYPYLFETEGAGNWMGRHFFTGGVMPSHELFHQAQDALQIEETWPVPGVHYAATANAWLERLDANREEVLKVMSAHYGPQDARLWLQRWRLFFLACAELFGFDNGSEWGVSHYRFRRAE